MPMTLEATYRTFRSSLCIVCKQFHVVQRNPSTYQPSVFIDLSFESGLIGITITAIEPEPDGGVTVAA
jgi:hypothetical protein